MSKKSLAANQISTQTHVIVVLSTTMPKAQTVVTGDQTLIAEKTNVKRPRLVTTCVERMKGLQGRRV